MENKIDQKEQFAKQLLETIAEIFGTDRNFHVEIETEDGTVTFGVKEDEKYCEKCEEKPKERLKSRSELTIGEKYVLYLLNNKCLKLEDINFDSVIETIVNNPLYDFMLTAANDELKQSLLTYISELTESLIKVNFAKLRVV